MKVTFEFDTDKEGFAPDELLRVQKADDLTNALWDLSNLIRGWYKNVGSVNAEEISEEFYRILDRLGVDLEKLWP